MSLFIYFRTKFYSQSMKVLINVLFILSTINYSFSQESYKLIKTDEDEIIIDGIIEKEEWKNAKLVDLKIEIELSLNSAGKVIEKKITNSIKSEKFMLVVMNGLSKARFSSLPKVLASNTPYRVLLKIIP